MTADADGGDVAASHAPLTAPSGYTPVFSTGGVTCWRQPAARPDYVCAADMRVARVHPVHGTPGTRDAYGETPFTRRTLSQLYAAASVPGLRPVVAVNASFFATGASPAPLSYPYKASGTLLNFGFGMTDAYAQRGQVVIASFWPDRQYAAIGPHSNTAAARTGLTAWGSAPDIVGALHPSADKDAGRSIPRTFLGVRDTNGDGTRETVLVFSSALASQAYAVGELRRFGATEIAMLDGGGSSGLIIDGTSYVTPSRTIPNALVLYAR
ncbi:MAG: phosphodiester glycosidase family protein [Sandaracinaceae bacterium]|nr:phosphodiester glycosidase family protein [Sandaracinaceae bacterium]